MKTQKVKVIELVFDWNLWPRTKAEDLDSTNITKLKDALRAGVELPPVVVNRKDYRIIDGFHRTRAYLALYGDAAEIPVDFRDYTSEDDMFLDSGRMNAIHGLALSPQDKTHFILKCKRRGIPIKKICEALGLDTERFKTFLEKRTATTKKGEVIPLPGGAMNLAGKTLTAEQEHFARTSNGMIPVVNARLLINALKSESIMLDDKTMSILTELRDLLDALIGGAE